MIYLQSPLKKCKFWVKSPLKKCQTFDLYYVTKKDRTDAFGLEKQSRKEAFDFVIRQNNESVLLEVKAATGNTKSAKTILKNFDKYHVSKAIKVGDYNIGEMGGILTLPHYMVMSGVMG